MTQREREFLGRVWLENGLGEHASVAAFARFVLHLMKLGAPPELLLEAIRAMEDEVHHARACFGIASRFTGKVVGPGEFDLEGVVDPSDDSTCILESAIIEGCVNETISTRYAEVAIERTQDLGIRRVLTRIVEDEARHAALAWRFLEWMLERRPGLAGIAERCFDRVLSAPSLESVSDEPAIAEQYGHLLTQHKNEIRQSMLHEVIGPRAVKILRT